MSLEKMDELFGITDDMLRIMDENQRERAASRAVPELVLSDVGLASFHNNATTMVASAGTSEKINTVSSKAKIHDPAYLI